MDDIPDIAALYLRTDVLVQDVGEWLPAGECSLASAGPFHVVTAWNPGTIEDDGTNRAANERLYRALRSRGLVPVPAIGRDPGSNHAEESWAVLGLTDAQARAIGAGFGQIAVFRITAQEQTVLACTEPRRLSRSLRPPESR